MGKMPLMGAHIRCIPPGYLKGDVHSLACELIDKEYDVAEGLHAYMEVIWAMHETAREVATWKEPNWNEIPIIPIDNIEDINSLVRSVTANISPMMFFVNSTPSPLLGECNKKPKEINDALLKCLEEAKDYHISDINEYPNPREIEFRLDAILVKATQLFDTYLVDQFDTAQRILDDILG